MHEIARLAVALLLGVVGAASCKAGRSVDVLPEKPAPSIELDASAPDPDETGGKARRVVAVAPPSASVDALAAAARMLEQKRGAVPPVTVGDPYDVQLRPAARKLLRQSKDAALAVVAARLAEIDGPALDDEVLTRAVQAALDPGEPADSGASSPRVHVARPPGHTERVVVVLEFEIPCGTDSVLAVMRRRGGVVAPELVVRADDYASISGGRLLSDWSMAPPAADGSFYLVTANASPWCSSSWRGIHYVAVAPSDDPKKPRVLAEYSGSAQVWDSVASIDARADGFTLSWLARSELTREAARTHAHAYAVSGAGFVRVAPAVRRPQDVLAEWIGSEVSIARDLVVPGAWASLAVKHASLHGKEPDAMTEITIDGKTDVADFEGLPPHVHVELTCASCSKFPRRLAADVERVSGSWRLRSLATD